MRAFFLGHARQPFHRPRVDHVDDAGIADRDIELTTLAPTRLSGSPLIVAAATGWNEALSSLIGTPAPSRGPEQRLDKASLGNRAAAL
jgi:hypothetical protein